MNSRESETNHFGFPYFTTSTAFVACERGQNEDPFWRDPPSTAVLTKTPVACWDIVPNKQSLRSLPNTHKNKICFVHVVSALPGVWFNDCEKHGSASASQHPSWQDKEP